MQIIITITKKIKFYLDKYGDAIFSVFLFLALGLTTFSLGMLYEREQLQSNREISIQKATEADLLWEEYQSQQRQGDYFGSRNGTKIYTEGCSAGSRIKDENKVFFETIQQAESLGYSLSSSC